MADLESQARIDWKRWGTAYAMHTTCSRCGQFLWCRGKRRSGMLCLHCFDLGASPRRNRNSTSEVK